MKNSRYKIKIICGYRKEQEYTIDANEAHKAYFLFNNPDMRGTFESGLALRGSDILRIVPDYQATMGWNHTHQLTDDDYNQMHKEGVMSKFQKIMADAKEIARIGNTEDMRTPLLDLVRGKYIVLEARSGSKFAQKVLASK